MPIILSLRRPGRRIARLRLTWARVQFQSKLHGFNITTKNNVLKQNHTKIKLQDKNSLISFKKRWVILTFSPFYVEKMWQSVEQQTSEKLNLSMQGKPHPHPDPQRKGQFTPFNLPRNFCASNPLLHPHSHPKKNRKKQKLDACF